jgi:hypothetical protein
MASTATGMETLGFRNDMGLVITKKSHFESEITLKIQQADTPYDTLEQLFPSTAIRIVSGRVSDT